MNKQQMSKALQIAQNKGIDLRFEDIGIFDGFGLPDFRPVHCTVRAVAALLRWQAQYLFGGWDGTAISDIADLGRHRFIIIEVA